MIKRNCHIITDSLKHQNWSREREREGGMCVLNPYFLYIPVMSDIAADADICFWAGGCTVQQPKLTTHTSFGT